MHKIGFMIIIRVLIIEQNQILTFKCYSLTLQIQPNPQDQFYDERISLHLQEMLYLEMVSEIILSL